MAEQVTDATFENVVLKSDIPVLLDFWAPWCGPCKKIGPDIEALADAMYGLITYPTLHTFLRDEGLKEVNNIKWEYAGQKVRKIYDQVLFGKQ